jgi:hypothetical protein
MGCGCEILNTATTIDDYSRALQAEIRAAGLSWMLQKRRGSSVLFGNI